MRFARGAVGTPYRLVQNRSQTSAVVRTSDAAAERSKDQLSRALTGHADRIERCRVSGGRVKLTSIFGPPGPLILHGGPRTLSRQTALGVADEADMSGSPPLLRKMPN
jgi:hypothetical protein